MAWVHPKLNDHVAHLPEVLEAVRQLAEATADKARALLAEHRDTGSMRIEVEFGGKTDWLVLLVDDDGGAIAAELGHLAPNGKFVEGLNILGRAADL
jgi:hypothetical protein